MSRTSQFRTYDTVASVVFLKTREQFGGLSNMAPGFPLQVNGIRIRTSEALYQACRFPHRPDVQRRIIDERSPMTAKMRSKPYRHDSRQDWNRVRVNVMRWCLRVKLAQNWDVFSELLLDTGERSIVEHSRKDDFWGAKPVDERTFVGMNVLGRLLMELRGAVKSKSRENLRRVEPLPIVDFLLGGNPIKPVALRTLERGETVDGLQGKPRRRQKPESIGVQLPLTRVPKVAARRSRADTTEWAGDGGIGHLKPYPAYKPSGVQWLGEVPEHWERRRLRSTSEMRVSNVDKHVKDDERPVRLCNYVDVYKNDRIRSGMAFMRATATTDEIERFRLRSGDVLITKDSESWNDIGVPALVEDTEADVISGYHLALLRPFPECLDGEYLFRTLQSPAVKYQFHVEANGVTRYGLSHSAIKSVWLPIPPLSEQAAIVRYLDHADRRIRRYISAKQRLITLLEEQKQVLIGQAVTGKLDVRTGQPYPAYSPSGVEWLGDVPAHWEVRAAKGYFREADERSETGSEELLSVSHITGVTPRSEKNITMFMAVSNVGYKLCRPGDLVINTMWAWMAALGVAKQSGIVSPSYAVYRPHSSSRLLGEYTDLLLRTMPYKSEYICRSTGIRSSRLRMYPEEFLRIKLLCPPPEEQRAIVEIFSKESVDARRAIDLAQGELSLLREYRTRLIADVVTGKLDVREAAARLPDEVEEPEPLDVTDALTDGEDEPADDLDAATREAEV